MKKLDPTKLITEPVKAQQGRLKNAPTFQPSRPAPKPSQKLPARKVEQRGRPRGR